MIGAPTWQVVSRRTEPPKVVTLDDEAQRTQMLSDRLVHEYREIREKQHELSAKRGEVLLDREFAFHRAQEVAANRSAAIAEARLCAATAPPTTPRAWLPAGSSPVARGRRAAPRPAGCARGAGSSPAARSPAYGTRPAGLGCGGAALARTRCGASPSCRRRWSQTAPAPTRSPHTHGHGSPIRHACFVVVWSGVRARNLASRSGSRSRYDRLSSTQGSAGGAAASRRRCRPTRAARCGLGGAWRPAAWPREEPCARDAAAEGRRRCSAPLAEWPALLCGFRRSYS